MPEVHQLPVGYVLPLTCDCLDLLALVFSPVGTVQHQAPFRGEAVRVEFTPRSGESPFPSHNIKPNHTFILGTHIE